MPSRSDKERKLKEHIEVATEREYRAELKKLKQSDNPKVREMIRKQWEKSARDVDKNKLHEVWND